MENKYTIGDIHGNVEALLELLNKVNFDYNKDLLISLGDLCDRGPNTWEVLETLLKIKNLILIIGNHDIWLLEYLTNITKNNKYIEPIWLKNGGITTIQSYINNNFSNIQNHIDLLKKAVPFYVTNKNDFIENSKGKYVFTHGGFDQNYDITNQDTFSMAWDRELIEKAIQTPGKIKFYNKDYKMIFLGHTPTTNFVKYIPGKGNIEIRTPIFLPNISLLDTGCGKGGKLTIYNLKDNTYIQTINNY